MKKIWRCFYRAVSSGGGMAKLSMRKIKARKLKSEKSAASLIAVIEISGTRVWLRRSPRMALIVWANPKTWNPSFSEEMLRWKVAVGAARLGTFTWSVRARDSGQALVLMWQMAGDSGCVPE